MSNPSPVSTPRRRLPGTLWLLLVLAAVVAAPIGWKAWTSWKAGDSASAEVDLRPEALEARLFQAEAAIANLTRGQEAQNQKLSDTRARTELLRDELLASTQRASLLEDSVRELANVRREDADAVRLDEIELILTMAQQRLQLAGDLPGAIRATELADGVLSSINDPTLLDLKQTMAQELAALRALPKDPAAVAAGELDALEAVLPKLAKERTGKTEASAAPEQGSMQRLLDSLVQIRPSGEQDLLNPSDRVAGEAALSLEIALARTALNDSDEAAFRRALLRIDGWMQRLFQDGPALRERRQRIKRLGELPLSYDLPVAGSTLQQLQQLLRSRQDRK